MEIVFDGNTLHQGPSGSITGVVYLQLAEMDFPVAGWNDFVVVVTTWWLEALSGLEHTSETELRFMDGPYHASVVRLSGQMLALRCTEDRAGPRVVGTELIGRAELTHKVRLLAQDLSNRCEAADMKSADLDDLRRYIL